MSDQPVSLREAVDELILATIGYGYYSSGDQKAAASKQMDYWKAFIINRQWKKEESP